MGRHLRVTIEVLDDVPDQSVPVLSDTVEGAVVYCSYEDETADDTMQTEVNEIADAIGRMIAG